jgi:type I site-specific restriction-modification system R (restriction) subunit
MNSTPAERIPESATAQVFKRDEQRLLIVVEKFQTGFGQPFLHTGKTPVTPTRAPVLASP